MARTITRRKEKEETLKYEKKEDGTLVPLKSVDNKLELLKYAAEVQSRLKDEITSDFILCKLDTQDKIGVTEMTVNAYLAARQVKNIAQSATNWKYNTQDKTWTKEEITEKEKELIEAYEKKIFDTFMTKVNMTSILNRNVPENYLLEILSGIRKEEQEIQEERSQEDGMVKKLISKMKRKDEEDER